MELHEKYHYCPNCKHDLTFSEGRKIACPSCDFTLYVNPIPVNAVILLNEAGEILLVRRKVDPGAGTLDLPGGFVEIKETLEESVKREIKEELNVEVSDIKYLVSENDRYLYKDVNDYTLGVIFTAKIKDMQNLKASDDAAEIKFCKPSEIPWDEIGFESIKSALKFYLEQAT